MEPRDGVLAFDPLPLPELSEFRFTVCFHGHRRVDVRLRISVPDSDRDAVRIVLPGQSATIAPGEARPLRLPRP